MTITKLAAATFLILWGDHTSCPSQCVMMHKEPYVPIVQEEYFLVVQDYAFLVQDKHSCSGTRIIFLVYREKCVLLFKRMFFLLYEKKLCLYKKRMFLLHKKTNVVQEEDVLLVQEEDVLLVQEEHLLLVREEGLRASGITNWLQPVCDAHGSEARCRT